MTLRVEEIVAVLCLVCLLGHSVWLWWGRRVTAPRLARGRVALARYLDQPTSGTGIDPALGRLRRRLQKRVLSEVAVSLRGQQRATLGQLASDLGLVCSARRACGSRFWWRRLAAVHTLSVFGAEDERLDRMLDDPHPAVRAEAIEWAGDHPEIARTRRLVQLLGDPAPRCRRAAHDSLSGTGGELAHEPITEALLDRSPSVAAPALRLASRRPFPDQLPAALSLVADPEPAVRSAAAALLGALGGPEAIDALQHMLGDAEPSVREAAASGLGHLAHWPAAVAVGRLLRDPAWVVRCAAGHSLVALGAPGQVVLRGYREDPDPFAADMARQVLDVLRVRSAQSGPVPA
ncbi:MAG: HEAT repeat domain-containing protein [Acidimicrobiales bacterium]